AEFTGVTSKVKMATTLASSMKKVTDFLAKPDNDGKGGVAGFVGWLLMVMFVVGALLSTYIPLIPFITWFSALTNYFFVVFEGLIAAQLWAMNHITTDGEGMGQRTERGYTHVLNVLLRPTIMVLAFFLASALNIVLGTLF